MRRLNEPKSRPNKPEGKTKQTKEARRERGAGACGGVGWQARARRHLTSKPNPAHPGLTGLNYK